MLTMVYLETICRELPSTCLTDVEIQNMDYSDPVFSPRVNAEQRRNGPAHLVIVQDVSSPFDDNDNDGVNA